jgi:hypothetical protein
MAFLIIETLNSKSRHLERPIVVEYEEIRHFGPENFSSLVDAQSTKRKSSATKDRFDRVTERTVFYKGNRIIGMQVRNANGYRYYIRK